ncbi:MAG: hypothetical protein FD163_475 [Hyphomonadaceae bacterium]|nr:MAG: hypothetical protein FD163_475 [Hyphomonadaceae bacterium]
MGYFWLFRGWDLDLLEIGMVMIRISTRLPTLLSASDLQIASNSYIWCIVWERKNKWLRNGLWKTLLFQNHSSNVCLRYEFSQVP